MITRVLQTAFLFAAFSAIAGGQAAVEYGAAGPTSATTSSASAPALIQFDQRLTGASQQKQSSSPTNRAESPRITGTTRKTWRPNSDSRPLPSRELIRADGSIAS